MASNLKGKQKRKEHWIYEVEKVLNLNHSDVARLLTPEPVSIDAMWDILEGRFDTPALKGLEFPVSAKQVTAGIAGQPLTWAEEAKILLRARLGLIVEVQPETGTSLWSFDTHGIDTPFDAESVGYYLGYWEQALRYEHNRIDAPFVATSLPIPIPPENIIRLG